MSMNLADMDRIAITGMGLVTSLGLSAPSSLAAIRSGIANFTEHETVLVHGNSFGTELNGAKIARLPEHAFPRQLHGAERAAALLAQASCECTDGLPKNLLVQAFWRFTGGPEPSKVPDLAFQVIRTNDAADSALERCGLFENIIQAAADLRNRTAPIIIVGCVDSLCDDHYLEKLFNAERLKSSTTSEGIVAGEAAGVFMLELESEALRRNADVLAYIGAWGRGSEPNPWIGNIPSIARGLRNAFEEAFSQLPGKGEEIDIVIADLNGERARANEWAIAASRIFPVDDKVRELNHPADCTGDCGAAMGAILLATAIGLMSAPQPPANIALSTSEDAGARRILCLQKGNGSGTEAAVPMACEKKSAVLPAVIEQHRDEVSFLWLIRPSLTTAPHRDLADLKRHDGRIDAHMAGLCRAGESGWEIARESLAHGDAGDYFSAAFLAFKYGNADWITFLLDKAGTNINRYKGVASALGWFAFDQVDPHIMTFLTAESPLHRYLGVVASAIHRRDPGHLLRNAALDPSPLLKARALRAYGELGRNGQLSLYDLQSFFSTEDDAVRFWASWSAALLGNQEAVEVLRPFVLQQSDCSEKALNVALRRTELGTALAWQKDLARSRETNRLAVIAAGVIGDAVLVPWLLEQMSDPALARVAGEAFNMITGVDMAEMEGTPPEDFTTGPNDDPGDDNVEIDPDEDLPWPNPELIAAWWNKNEESYPGGTRHLLGKPICEDCLQHVLMTGSQRVRAASALELAVMKPGRPLFEVRAPAFRQVTGTQA